MQLVSVTPPAAEPLTAAEAKARLNLGSEVTDAVVDALIKGARQNLDGADGWLGRALITQTWDLILGSFPCEAAPYSDALLFARDYRSGAIKIPLPPLQSITHVKYVDGAGLLQTVDSGDYEIVRGAPAWVRPIYGKAWPSIRGGGEAVTIRFVAGYGTAGSSVPETIRNGLVLQVAHLRSVMAQNLYVRREEVAGVGSMEWIVSEAAQRALSSAADNLLLPLRVYL